LEDSGTLLSIGYLLGEKKLLWIGRLVEGIMEESFIKGGE